MTSVIVGPLNVVHQYLGIKIFGLYNDFVKPPQSQKVGKVTSDLLRFTSQESQHI